MNSNESFDRTASHMAGEYVSYTANEMADLMIQFDSGRIYEHAEEIATMLRQQQAEIERLIGAEPITYGMFTVCKNCGQQNPYFEKAQEK
jgi:hypothetical protein